MKDPRFYIQDVWLGNPNLAPKFAKKTMHRMYWKNRVRKGLLLIFKNTGGRWFHQKTLHSLTNADSLICHTQTEAHIHTPNANFAMEHWIGLLCAAFAAIAFGVQYAPVLWHLMTTVEELPICYLFINQSSMIFLAIYLKALGSKKYTL